MKPVTLDVGANMTLERDRVGMTGEEDLSRPRLPNDQGVVHNLLG